MKKNLKRVFAAAIIYAFLFMIMTPLQLHAANELTFTVGVADDAARGGTVTVPVSVSNNPGFTAVGLMVTYDPNVLEITGVTAPIPAMPLNSQFMLTATPGTQWINLVNTALVDWSGDGVVVILSFNVKSTASLGVSPVFLSFTGTPNGTPASADGTVITNASLISRSVNIVDNNNANQSPALATLQAPSTQTSSTQTPSTQTPSTQMPSTQTPSTQMPSTQAPSTPIPAAVLAQAPPTQSPLPVSTPAVTSTPAESQPEVNESTVNANEEVPSLEGGFIGREYDDDGSLNSEDGTDEDINLNDVQNFGRVPQTGYPDNTWAIIAMLVSFLISVILYSYLLYHRQGNIRNFLSCRRYMGRVKLENVLDGREADN